MADPPDKKAEPKMPWGMKIGKLKPGARETITDKKLATFVAGKQKKSRLQKVMRLSHTVLSALELSDLSIVVALSRARSIGAHN